MSTHWQTAKGGLLCGSLVGPGDRVVPETEPVDCLYLHLLLVVASPWVDRPAAAAALV